MENKNKPTLKTFDTDDSENENMLLESSLKIYIGQVFQTWIDAETFLNDVQYIKLVENATMPVNIILKKFYLLKIRITVSQNDEFFLNFATRKS
ncbi:unnamed protein product [Rhizophagus irregularis]|nr:unnamed protein product [Rhizophagus irregularis]